MKKHVKVISLINMKGGVGKTTLAVNIAYALAYFYNKKILIIDVDPQFNATQYLMKEADYIKHIKKGKLTILDIFKERPETVPSVVLGARKEKIPKLSLKNIVVHIYRNEKTGAKLDLIPSTLQLMELDQSARGTEFKLKRFVDKVKNAYDYIFIDCPPTLSIFTLSAYLASDAILVPIKPDILSTIGLPLLERAIQEYEQNYGIEVRQLWIVFTMVDKRTNLMKRQMKEISQSRVVFKNYLRQSIRVAEAVKNNEPLFLSKRASDYGIEIKKITEELLQLLGCKNEKEL